LSFGSVCTIETFKFTIDRQPPELSYSQKNCRKASNTPWKRSKFACKND